MSRYKAYPEYKKSGVEWLGSVPKSWNVSRLAYVFVKANAGEVIDKSHWGEGDELLYTCNRTPLKSDFSEFPEDKRTGANDLLLTRNGTPYVHKPIPGSLYSNVVQRIVLKKKFDRDYLMYCLGNSATNLKGYGVSIESLNFENWKSLSFSYPEKPGQRRVVKFLDYETAKIDDLIDKQQQLIKLLKEKRQAVISHAVTKGLNPDAPMRDSGVEWLGDVPAHWEIRAVSKVSQKITNGYVGPTRDILVPKGVPYVQATHIKKGKVNFDDAYFVRPTWSDAHAKSILVKGDVLIVQTGAGTGDIGLVTEDEEGFNCHALIIVQPITNVIAGNYLSMLFQSHYGYSVLYSIRTGGMHPHLNCGEVKFVKVPVPPKGEQDKITEYINQQLCKFDNLIELQVIAIQLMQERRTALISAAVTGKIDVRDWQPA